MKSWFLMCALFLMTACSSLPLPVQDKPTECGALSAGKSDDNKRNVECELPMGDISSFDKVKAKFKGYYLTYINEAKAKRTLHQRASETGFYGSILSVIGGLTQSLPTVITGATAGAGSSLYSDRYKLEIQATNYETAADAMLCMYLASQDIHDDSVNKFIVDNQSADIAARDVAIDGLLRVTDKLYRLQSSLELGKPDPNELKEALMIGKSTPTPKNGEQSLLSDNQTIEALAVYKSKIGQCVAKITG